LLGRAPHWSIRSSADQDAGLRTAPLARGRGRPRHPTCSVRIRRRTCRARPAAVRFHQWPGGPARQCSSMSCRCASSVSVPNHPKPLTLAPSRARGPAGAVKTSRPAARFKLPMPTPALCPDLGRRRKGAQIFLIFGRDWSSSKLRESWRRLYLLAPSLLAGFRLDRRVFFQGIDLFSHRSFCGPVRQPAVSHWSSPAVRSTVWRDGPLGLVINSTVLG